MRLAAGLSAVLGLVTLLAGVTITAIAYEPIPFGDFIDFLRRFREAGEWSGYGLEELYARHNEHRILVPRLWFLADLALVDGRQTLLIAIILASLAALGLLVSALARGLGLAWPAVAGFCCVALGGMLSPVQWENLVWGFQVQFVQVWLFAALAFTAVGTAPAGGDVTGSGRAWAGIVAGILFGLAATYSMANGVLVWPLAIALALWRGLPGLPTAVLALAGIAVTVVEIGGFEAHPGHADPLQSLAEPVAVLHYALRYLTAGLDALGTLGRDVVGALLLAFVLGSAAMAIALRSRLPAARGVLLAIAGFVIGAAILTGLGRMTFGVGQADSVRYATPSMLFLLVCAALLLDLILRLRRQGAAAAAALAGSVVLLVPGLVGGIAEVPTVIADRDARVRAVAAYLAGGYRPETLSGIYPLTPVVSYRVLAWLDRNDLGPFSVRDRYVPGPVTEDATVPPPGQVCRGSVDRAVRDVVAGIAVTGWLTAEESGLQPDQVLLVDATGTVRAWGLSRIRRDDVGEALEIDWQGRGFEALGPWTEEDPGSLNLVGVFQDGSRCRLAAPIGFPAPRFVGSLPGTGGIGAVGAWSVLAGTPTGENVGSPPPPQARPALGTIGSVPRLEARFLARAPSVDALLAVPVRTDAFPVDVVLELRDDETGERLDGHAFTRPSAPDWTWWIVAVRAERSAARLLRLQASAPGPFPWQSIAVGQPRWLPAGAIPGTGQ